MDIAVEKSKVTKLDLATWAGFTVFAASAIIIAVSLPEISRTFSTNLAEGGGIETVRTVVMVVVLLLAGILAQRWGKKRFLAAGQYLNAAGLLLASFSQNYTMLVLALMITGIGGGFAEALLNPLIVDIHDQESGRFLNISHAFFPAGVMASALLFGELLTLGYSWRVLFRITALATLFVAILFTVLRYPAAQRDESSYPKMFASILSQKGFWLFALVIAFGASIESALTFWSRTYVEFYLSDVPRAGALAVMIFAGGMTIGRFLSGYLANKISLNSIMLGSALLGICVSIFIPLATTLNLFYTLLAFAGLATASFWPTILAEADTYLSVNTTILFVLLSAIGMIGFGFTPFGMGLIGDNAELRVGFTIIPVLFGGLILLLTVERRISKRASNS